ncbi:MAG TPA: response regulator transcription factor [Thermoanaerobaculia bacterium]|nr:response regulator transcription factor [Thermoanaerobaculia bacterium]
MSDLRPRVLLADDHPMMLAGLRKLLEPELEVVGTVMDGQLLLAAAERLRPDLVITDIGMPGLDGIEATRRLQASLPGVKVLILSIHAEPSCVQAAFAAGAWGYLPKTSAPEEIERAVREILADRFYVSPAVARAAIGTARGCESPPPVDGETLTQREQDILRLLAEGMGNKQIARRLGVAVTTVRTHLSSVYEKLRLESRVELALYAAQIPGMAA